MNNKMNKYAGSEALIWLTKALLAGNFPEVDYQKTDYGACYNMIDYALVKARLARCVSDKIVSAGFEKGIFSPYRSAAFIAAVDSIMSALTVDEVKNYESRYKTMFD